jgi:hypothetical protein
MTDRLASGNLHSMSTTIRVSGGLLGLAAAMLVLAPSRAEATHHKAKHAEEAKKEQQAPKGPLIISVSIASQHLTVFDGGSAVAHAPVSTGMAGHPTPMGVFSVIQKQRWHQSNIYSGAPMPFMQRVTWSGVAMHAGVLPGYPASHGCIRMPHEFAVRLYGMTKMGVRVFITRNDVTPVAFADARLFTPKPQADAQLSAPAPTQDLAVMVPAKTDVVLADAGTRSNDAGGAEPAVKADPAKTGEDADKAGHDASASEAKPAADGSRAEPSAPDADSASKAGDAVSVSDATQGDDAADVPLPRVRPQLPPVKPAPVSVFISKKLGKLFVRKGFEAVFDSAVTIANPERSLGTHVFTAADFTDDHAAMRWLLVSLPSEAKKEERRAETTSHKRHKGDEAKAPVDVSPPETAAGALARIEIPEEARERIGELLTPGSSLIISDKDLGPETGESGETDFIVLTR